MKIQVSTEVREALNDGVPVVALESTVVTHGLPHPRNLHLARDLEHTVRDGGGVPATIGMLGGTLFVGLDEAQLVHLANSGAEKASLWNLAALLAAGRDAGTTVATTLHAAHAVGIRVFATGGIGGVHDVPFDESADLAALARTPVITVCAGPKSILDARATIERLESAGVPVLGFRSDHVAGFHLETTDIAVAARVDDVATVARVYRAHRELGLSQGIVISNPVSHGIDPTLYAGWLAEAHTSAEAAGMTGHATTPYLLGALAEVSGGTTVDVNVRLLQENARLAVQIAAALPHPMSGPGAQP